MLIIKMLFANRLLIKNDLLLLHSKTAVAMNVEFSNDMKSYRDYVTHPEDRKAMRKFC